MAADLPFFSWHALLCLVLFTVHCTVDVPVSSAMDCDGDDRAALLRVKSQLGDPVQLLSWLPSTNCCAWEPPAVFCSAAGRVTGLALSSLDGVRAPVPPALGELPELVILQVQSVRGLSGPIPPSLANLTRLEDLNIAGTSISGPVPGFLAGIATLRTIVIADGKLAGSIPACLSSLPELRYLDLSGNMLTGAIPPGLLHGSFRFLILANNRLTGEIPADLGDADVDTLDLSRNRLAGDPSPFLFSMTKAAAKMDLSWNELEFDMTDVRFPHHLRYLDLSHNRINGSVPKSLRDVRVDHFDVSYNGLCGEIPAGRFMELHGPDCYDQNKCLCGTPLPPCTADTGP
ncbi:polygalacturonase inhibitor 1-like [Lolium rigidum]|uniref:polygalacturonase inhibitor 1-like n=1 Tax=Lolium rigidum TaxID=89674 RepID=UPI001F5D16EB|nr:polygalacturonase inhibitor 1-like [Lolium rigidum]